MGFTRVVILLFTTSLLAKIYEYLNGSSPQPELSHVIMSTPSIAACLDIMSQNWDKLAIITMISIGLGMLIAWALFIVCRKPVVQRDANVNGRDTSAIQVMLTNANQLCDNVLANGADVHAIGNIKTLLKTSLDYLTKAKVE
jgi:hypothetical protein